ncbi:hypothetical protein HOD19_00340 [bacterium]|nr:hypothetical protein [bacterium]MBT4649264.1 hypothetical protein [bacterium]
MSKTFSFQLASSARDKKLRSGDYWAVVTLCSILSFMLLMSSAANI